MLRSYFTFLLISLVLPLTLYAATISAIADGNWTDTAIWSGGVVPGPGDDVLTGGNLSLTVQSTDDISITSLTLGSNNNLIIEAGGKLTINNAGLDALILANINSLIVHGTLIVNGNFDVGNVLNLEVTGDFIINGDVNVMNGGTLNIDSSGSFTIDGDITGGNDTDFSVDGVVDVSGSVDLGNSSDLTGTGTFSVGGTCTGPASFCESSILPLELLYFKANPVNTYIKLEWATFDEDNFDHFCIERSSYGLVYYCIAEIQSAAAPTNIEDYTYSDKFPLIGRSYYRLKTVDIDGSYKNHPIVSVKFNDGPKKMNVYPNPVQGSELHLDLNYQPENSVIKVYGMSGRIILQQKVTSEKVHINLPADLLPGVYIVEISGSNQSALRSRILVN